MSYSKKDEDGDTAILKVDRTSVFQEGMDLIERISGLYEVANLSSSALQYLAHFTP